MPVRDKAVTMLTEKAIGGPIAWNGLNGMPWEPVASRTVSVHGFVSRPAMITLDEWDDTYEKSEALYFALVHAIDWTRVLIEAAGFHARKQEEDPEHKDLFGFDLDVCGPCIQDALLATR